MICECKPDMERLSQSHFPKIRCACGQSFVIVSTHRFLWSQVFVNTVGGSSSGRTTDSDSVNLGSNPSPPANKQTAALWWPFVYWLLGRVDENPWVRIQNPHAGFCFHKEPNPTCGFGVCRKQKLTAQRKARAAALDGTKPVGEYQSLSSALGMRG
jgi:hypothetical protein